jgi:membrane fusion protein (multidrug efflux system)
MTNIRSLSRFLPFLIPALLVFSCKDGSQNQGQGKSGQKPLTVLATIARPGLLENKILATGSVIANEEVELHSELPGRIVEISFEEGSQVFKGSLLLKIDDRELQAQL